jgi:hypothetical protein
MDMVLIMKKDIMSYNKGGCCRDVDGQNLVADQEDEVGYQELGNSTGIWDS